MPRTFAEIYPGNTSTESPFFKRPEMTVPVTTVPKPVMEKTRSAWRRKKLSSFDSCTAAAFASNNCFNSVIPSFVCTDVRTTSTLSKIPSVNSRISSSIRSSHSPSSAKSILERATTHWGIFSSFRMCKCSRV